MADNLNNGALDWGATLESDGREFVILPEGDYQFTVKEFERGRFPGSAKLPACNKAVLTLEIVSAAGIAYIKTDLILHKSLEWKLAQFFRSIGLKKHGEPLVMDWKKVPGATGRCYVVQREYIGRDGAKRTTNDIDRFIDWDPEKVSAPDKADEAAYSDIPF